MEQYKDLYSITEKIWMDMERISKIYAQTKSNNVKGDFHTEVKPFADEIKEKKDQWEKLASQWVKETVPKNLHKQQIESASEQIEMLSIQAFYPDTSRTRFINYLQSVRYILKRIMDELEKAGIQI